MTAIPPDFDVYVDHVSRRVEVVGELDLATIDLMIEAAETLRTEPPRDITVDLGSVTFLGAGAFGALVGLSNIQHAHDALLHVIGNSRVRSIAGLCGLDSLLI
jgi:anti-anti-sigma regulatory factor